MSDEPTPPTDTQFRAMLDLAMVSDPWALPGEHESAYKAYLIRESQRRGYADWIEAYHDLLPGVEQYE